MTANVPRLPADRVIKVNIFLTEFPEGNQLLRFSIFSFRSIRSTEKHRQYNDGPNPDASSQG